VVDEYWDVACQTLADRIPESLQTAAHAWKWIKQDDNVWELPTFMSELWKASKEGRDITLAYELDELLRHGFTDTEVAFRALKELEAAWAGSVSLDVIKDETCVLVAYSIPLHN
jgi:hypothetical protein